jgi:hypothetical protein
MSKLEFLAFQAGIYSKIVDHDAASSANTFGRGKQPFKLT